MSNFYPFALGNFSCIALSDFARERTLRDTFPRIDPIELQKEIKAGGYDLELDTPMPLHGVVLLVDNGDQKIMIDAGLPASAGGQTLDSLAAAGLAPTDIDLIIVTHGDGDHIGGLSHYPKAEIVMPPLAYNLWTEDVDGMVEEFIRLFRGTVPDDELSQQAAGRRAYHDTLVTLNTQGRIRLVKPGAGIVPGVSLIHAPGHRRDHIAVEIKSGEAVLLHIADAFRHPIQLKRPDFYCLFDSYPKTLAESMEMLFDRAATSNAIVFGAHFEFPALIRIEKDEAGYRWVTL